MKKHVFGRKFKRDKNERKALFKSLMSSLILNERIQTTEEKAKAIKPEIEKLVTKAKKATSSSTNTIRTSINPNAFDKFIQNVAPRFGERQGGYTRIVRLHRRLGDGAQMVVMEWVEGEIKKPATTETQKKTETQKLSASKKLRASAVARKTSKRSKNKSIKSRSAKTTRRSSVSKKK